MTEYEYMSIGSSMASIRRSGEPEPVPGIEIRFMYGKRRTLATMALTEDEAIEAIKGLSLAIQRQRSFRARQEATRDPD